MKSIFIAIVILLSTTLANAQSNDDRYFASWGNKKVAAQSTHKKVKVRKREYVEPRYYARIERKQRRYAGESYAPDPVQWVAKSIERVVSTVIGGRPQGCPRQFCGCGASLEVFGRIIPRLNLAANWLAFPRAEPAPGMAAARPGHVFILKQHIAGNTWLVHDSNSGRGRTRIHPRSIAGFRIVNPKGENG